MADTKSKIGGDSAKVKQIGKQVNNALLDFLMPNNGLTSQWDDHYARMENPGTSYTDPSIPARKYVGPGAYVPPTIPGQVDLPGGRPGYKFPGVPSPNPKVQVSGPDKSTGDTSSKTAFVPQKSQQMDSRTILVDKWKQAIEQKQKTSTQGGNQVAELQKKLLAAGFNPGNIDGIMGPKTQAALQAYNAAQQAANAKSAYQGIQTPMQSIEASSWRRTPNTLWMEKGGKIISDIISEFKKGGKIKIKPENKGKFTASAKKAGKGVQEHAKSVLSNPKATALQKKRANFAANAAKWKKG